MFQQYSTSSRNVMPHTFWAQAVKAVIVVLVLHYDAAPLHSLNSRQIRRSRYKVRTPTTDIWTTRCRPRGVQYTSDR
jgi:succinate dehydrogenase hydrophobic anchor subunit